MSKDLDNRQVELPKTNSWFSKQKILKCWQTRQIKKNNMAHE